MLMETESGIWARADAQVFRLLMDGDRSPRRRLAADRTIAGAIRRVAALRQRRAAQDAREHAAAERRLARECAPAWGRAIRVRAEPVRAHNGAKAERCHRALALGSTSRRAIRTYTAQIKDARGRVAVYFRIRYLGLKSKGWRAGLAADHVLYILRDGAQEQAGIEHAVRPISNMGTSAEEIAAGWRVLEAMEEGYRANAKVQYRIVWNLPHNLTPDQRHALVEQFCERTFGPLGLPYVAAIHTADCKGDARNVHAHIAFSTRPLDHVGDHQWAIAQEKVNGLTDPAGLTLMRALAAAHMNRACHAAGQDARFTHETYAKRGIDAVRQSHLGPARVAAHEQGQTVAAVTRNAQIVARNELAIARDATAKALDVATGLADALRRQIAGDDEQHRVAVVARAALAIATRARMVASRRRPPHPLLEAGALQRCGQHARTVARGLAARARVVAVAPPAAIGRIATGWRAAGALATSDDGHRAALAHVGDRLAAIRQRVTDARGAEQIAVQQRLETLLMGAKTRPYALRAGRLFLDLSPFDEQDAAFILAVDRNLLGERLRERHRHDGARDEAEARAQQIAEEERVAADNRQRQIDEACRLLRGAPVRPYRRDGRRLSPNLNVFDASGRATIAAIGFGEPALVDALIQRATHDRMLDEQATAADVTRRRSMLERLFRALDEERHHLVRGDDGWRVPPPLRARFGIADDVEVDPGVQRRLTQVAERQAGEIARIAAHVAATPRDLHLEDGRWALDATAPADVRRAVDAWCNDPAMQAALARAAAVVPATPSPASDASKHSAPTLPPETRPVADAAPRPGTAASDTAAEKAAGADAVRRVRRWPPPGTSGMEPGG